MRSTFRMVLSAVVLALSLFACDACRSQGTTRSTSGGTPVTAERPALRLYLVTDLAGALEPCGCVKDQLGGMDKLGALVAKDKGAARAHATLAVGPTFFMDPRLTGERRAQEIAKAETIAKSLGALGAAAITPGRNDWAAGPEALSKLGAAATAAIVAANVTGAGVELAKWKLIDAGEVKVGVVGVSSFGDASPTAEADAGADPLADAKIDAAIDAAKAAATEATKQGAKAIVVLAATGRGEAKRIADAMPDALAVVVGSPTSSGDANTQAAPAERVGDVLVVQAGNHLQTVGVLDLFARPGAAAKFADGTGVDAIRKREEIGRRIDELRVKIAVWERDGTIPKADVEARKADLAKLTRERDALDQTPPPKDGNFYRYAMRDVRGDLGEDEAVKAQMLAYYKKVNEDNRAAFADRKPRPPAKGEPGYAGIDLCTNCHEDARKVWDKTAHASAYKTLADQYKQFNLDCVSCHVTGYDRPGGSTVVQVGELTNVQCEVCHGPSSLHAKSPDKVKPPVPKPSPDSCAACHHPPHVHEFDAKAKMSAILGPGHGQPAK